MQPGRAPGKETKCYYSVSVTVHAGGITHILHNPVSAPLPPACSCPVTSNEIVILGALDAVGVKEEVNAPVQ